MKIYGPDDIRKHEELMVVVNTADLPSPYDDNVYATCSRCGAAAYHRPHVPTHAQLVCLSCFKTAEVQAEVDGEEMGITEETLRDLAGWLRKID